MRPSWVRWINSGEAAVVAALYLSFFGILTHRNRRNKFLFFAGLTVLVGFTLLYLCAFRVALTTP
jgi:Na+/melibiose symporter-like transporter